MAASSEWVTVAEFTNHPEAALARNLLEAHGIEVAEWSDDCGGMAVGQTVIQRVRLFVRASDIEPARDMLGRGEA
jgi:hypothetical protein